MQVRKTMIEEPEDWIYGVFVYPSLLCERPRHKLHQKIRKTKPVNGLTWSRFSILENYPELEPRSEVAG
jgi:hypothetical protein